MVGEKRCPTERWKGSPGKAEGQGPAEPPESALAGPQATVAQDVRGERSRRQALGGQEQESGGPQAEQDPTGSGGHHGGGGCSRTGHPACYQGVVPTPALSPSPVKLFWTQRCPWSWEEGWMSTEKAGPRGASAGAIRPAAHTAAEEANLDGDA